MPENVNKRLALLFTDMEGSTEVSSARGDDTAMALMRVHETAVRNGAAAHGGRVVKSTGDGYLVAFDTSVCAVAAALEIRRALAEHNAPRGNDRVLVRMGIHAGPTIAASGDLYGLAVNAAARITAKASAGQVLVSEVVRDECSSAPETGVRFVDRGLFWLKGIREQWRLHEAADDDGAVAAGFVNVGERTTFVGRDAQRALLRRHVDAAADGRGGVVLVTGSEGSGKSRLMAEVGAEATGRGLQCVSARCYEAAETAPYGPIVEVLESLEKRLGHAVFLDAAGDGAQHIARLLPNIDGVETAATPLTEWPLQEARAALFATLRDLLARLAAVRPIVIVIDDLHWADEATLHAVEYLASELTDVGIALLAAYADDEPLSPPFRSLVESLHRRRLAQVVDVPPLTETDVAALLAAIAPGAPPPELVAVLHDATGGNPFFLEEVVRHLVDRGVVDDGGHWSAAAVAELEVDVPDTVRFTVESRLNRVSPATRQVLVTAAVVGRDFGFELLEELADLSEDELLDVLDEAERARLIQATAVDGDVRFAFAHGLIRSTLAAEMSLTRRQRLHLRVADALERVHKRSLADHAADIAFHLTSAGGWADANRTATFLLLAGDRAIAAAAYEEALRHLDRALSLIGDDVAGRAGLLERMGMAERSLGHLDDALSLWEAALDGYDSIGARTDVARLCLTASIQVAWWRRGGEVMELVERGLEALDDDDSPLRGGLLALAGGVASQAGSYDQASRLLEDALEIARRHQDDAVLGLALYSLAVHHFSYYHYDDVVRAGRASMKHLRRAGDVWNLANVQGYVAASLGWLGRVREAEDVGRQTMPFARRLGNWSAYVFAEGGCAFADVGTQPAAPVLARRGEEALALGRDLGFPWLISIGHARLGLAAFFDGRWDEAMDRVIDAARGEVRSASGGHLGRVFLLHAYLGHREEALSLIEEAQTALPVVGHPNSGTSWTLALAAVEALELLGEDERAGALYATVIDHAATGTVMRSWDYRLVSTLAGIAAGCRGEFEQGERHFAHAVRQARQLPMRHEEPDALRFHAALLLKRCGPGDAEKATRLLGEAAVLYRELGMSRHAELASSMMPFTPSA